MTILEELQRARDLLDDLMAAAVGGPDHESAIDQIAAHIERAMALAKDKP